MANRKSCSGFTLVELLMVVGLFSLILGSTMGVFLTGQMAWNTGQASIEIQQQARYGINAMVRELNLSQHNKVKGINAGTLALQVPLNAATEGGDGRSRIDIDASGNLVWGADGNQGYWIEYIVENGQLKRKVFNQRPDYASAQEISDRTLARYIQGVSFVADQISANPDWPQGLEITVTAARGNSNRSLSTVVFFKN